MAIFVEGNFVYIPPSPPHTHINIEKLSGSIHKNRKETEWLGNRSWSEIYFSPYTHAHLLNFESGINDTY